MPTKPKYLPEKIKGAHQLSNKELQERMRPFALRAIQRLSELIDSKQENIALGASKEVVGRFVPMLKQTSLDPETTNMVKQILGGRSSVQSNDSNPEVAETPKTD